MDVSTPREFQEKMKIIVILNNFFAPSLTYHFKGLHCLRQ